MDFDLAIHPATTRVVVFTWPDRSVTWELAAWLRMFPPENVFEWHAKHLIAARNQAMRRLCIEAPPEITDFVWVDRDMRPDPRSLPVLQAEGDLVGTMYPLANMETWATQDAVHMGLVRFSRKTVEAVAPPWFEFRYSPDGCAVTQCECGYFAEKVRKAGFAVVRAGWSEHGTGGGNGAYH